MSGWLKRRHRIEPFSKEAWLGQRERVVDTGGYGGSGLSVFGIGMKNSQGERLKMQERGGRVMMEFPRGHQVSWKPEHR